MTGKGILTFVAAETVGSPFVHQGIMPQWLHVWGWHSGTTRQSPTAIRTTSSSMHRPRDVGCAFIQGPGSVVEAAKSFAEPWGQWHVHI